MNNNELYLLLDVINRNGSIKLLINNGIDFNEIAARTSLAITEGFVTNSENRIILTDSGIKHLKNLEITYKKTNKKEWIKKDEISRIDKNRRDKNFIFVPRQSDLNF
jgi:tmRNA-binding protein